MELLCAGRIPFFFSRVELVTSNYCGSPCEGLFDVHGAVISGSFSKIYSLNHYLKSHLSKNHFLYFYTLQQLFIYSPTDFLYLVGYLESYPRYLSLTSEKSRI